MANGYSKASGTFLNFSEWGKYLETWVHRITHHEYFTFYIFMNTMIGTLKTLSIYHSKYIRNKKKKNNK